MIAALRRALGDRGATFLPPDAATPAGFGDPVAEFDALWDGVAWSWEPIGAVLAAGDDLPDLLNRLSTRRVDDLAPGDGRPTVLTSPKGRIVHRLWCHHLGADGVLLVGAAGSAGDVIAHLDRFTFAERTGLSDASSSFAAFPVRGPRAARAVAETGLAVPERYGTSTTVVDGVEVRVLGHDLHSDGGLTVLVPAAAAPAWLARIDAAVSGEGGRPAGHASAEAWRICRGVPAAGSELNEDHNPLEAGLWDAVDFTKGCYVGQEVVARLRTYDKIARSLLVIDAPAGSPDALPDVGATVHRGDRAVGRLASRSAVPGRSGWVGLAYVKRGRVEAGQPVTVGDDAAAVEAIVREAPHDPRR